MEGKYIREGNKNYLVIENVLSKKEDYSMKMLQHNSIQGLLKVNVRVINNCENYYYDLENYKPLSMIFKEKEVSVETVISLFENIDKLIDKLKEYLLDADKIVLDMEYIYIDSFSGEIRFIYYPEENRKIENSIRCLMERLMENMEYKDRRITIRFYEAYQGLMRGNTSVKDIIKKLKIEPEIEKKEEAYGDEEEVIIKAIPKETVSMESEVIEARPPKYTVVIKIISAVGIVFFMLSQMCKIPYVPEISFTLALVMVIMCIVIYIFIDWWGKEHKIEEIKLLSVDEKLPYTVNVKREDERVSEPDPEIYEESKTMLLKDSIELQRDIKLKFLDKNDNNRVYNIKKMPSIIGASNDSDIIIKNPMISRKHASITEKEGSFYIRDMFSTNGTFINNICVAPDESVEIFNGDIIRFANEEFIVKA